MSLKNLRDRLHSLASSSSEKASSSSEKKSLRRPLPSVPPFLVHQESERDSSPKETEFSLVASFSQTQRDMREREKEMQPPLLLLETQPLSPPSVASFQAVQKKLVEKQSELNQLIKGWKEEVAAFNKEGNAYLLDFEPTREDCSLCIVPTGLAPERVGGLPTMEIDDLKYLLLLKKIFPSAEVVSISSLFSFSREEVEDPS